MSNMIDSNMKPVKNSSKHEENRVVHKCHECSIVFKKKYHLDQHLVGHTRNNCGHCNAQFTKRKELCKHLKAEHNINEPEKLYHCSFCDKSFAKKSSLIAHMKNHSDGKPTCARCGFMCENDDDYVEHLIEHSKNLKYECELCNKKFERTQQYNQHMSAHKRHVCEPCNLTFPTKKLLRKHQQKIHGAKVLKKHQCKICGKRFTRPIHLAVHQQMHTGEKPLKCLHCDKNYLSSASLAKHLKSVCHLKKIQKDNEEEIKIEKKFVCDKCGSKFYRQQSLIRHVEMAHTPGEPLKCEHCEYNTKVRANLKRHSQLHSDVKRYKCQLCGQAFRALATLKDHAAFVHSDKRDFHCDVDMCGKSFKNKSDLQRHRKSHSDDRPFKCSCIRSYKRLSHLKRHMETSKHYVDTFNKYAQTEEGVDEEISTNVNSPETLALCQGEDQDSSCDEPLPFNEIDNNIISNESTYDTREVNNNCATINSETKEKEHIVIPSNDLQMFFDIYPISSENITLYPLTPLVDQPVITLAESSAPETIALNQASEIIKQPILTLTNDTSAENIAISQLTAVMEEPVVSPTNNSTAPQLTAMSQLLDQSVITYEPSPENIALTNDSSPENSKTSQLTTVLDQSVMTYESPTQNVSLTNNLVRGCTIPQLSEVLEQPVTYEPSTGNETLITDSLGRNNAIPQLASVLEQPITYESSTGNVVLPDDSSARNSVIPQLTAVTEDSSTESNIISQLNAVLEQSIMTFEPPIENVTIPPLTTIVEHPFLTFTEQVPSVNPTMCTMEQSLVNSAKDNKSPENITSTTLPEVTGQNCVSLTESEPTLSNNSSFENQSLTLDPSSYCSFFPFNTDQSTILTNQEGSQIVLSMSAVEDNLNRPQSLPSFSFQQSIIDLYDQYTDGNDDTSISNALSENPVPSTFMSDVEQNDYSKQLFGESSDILVTLPSYTNQPFYNSNCPSQLFNPSISGDIWNNNCDGLKIGTDGDTSNNVCNTVYIPIPNLVTTVPVNLDNILLPSESFISCPIDSSVFNTEFC